MDEQEMTFHELLEEQYDLEMEPSDLDPWRDSE